VRVLASTGTSADARAAGFETFRYRRAPQPDLTVVFEAQAERVMRDIAGAAIAFDVHGLLVETRPDLLVADCMLPAALAAAQATSTRAASVVHFLYGPVRREMVKTGSGWTTDLEQLNTTLRALDRPPFANALAAWEAPELLLVTAPRWFDLAIEYPSNVIHAGPIAVAAGTSRGTAVARDPRPRIAATFSTTAIDGQTALIQRVSDAVARADLDAVLTLGPAQRRESLDVPGNVEVVASADHDRLFPQCRAVVCHGGLGTVLRALSHGVPLLVLPLGRDQHLNAERVTRLGAGLHLDAGACPDTIRKALEHLVEAPQFHRAAKAAGARIAAGKPDASACRALERIGRLNLSGNGE
jgi:UDP:flavonoid glycosyltransferase YjiC (YdhE family)